MSTGVDIHLSRTPAVGKFDFIPSLMYIHLFPGRRSNTRDCSDAAMR